jgi:ketosteroid isomerase-like protein
MSDHPNAATHRRVHEAFLKGDTSLVNQVLADDVVYHFPGRSSFAGDHAGREAVLAHLKRFVEIPGGSMKLEARDFLGSDDHSGAVYKVEATRATKELTGDLFEIMRWRKGRVVEDWAFFDDQEAFDAFFS